MRTDQFPVAGQVMSIGELLVDFIVADGSINLETAQSFVARSGGAPANVAVALARLAVSSAFCGVAGVDPFGKRLRQALIAEHVDTSRLRQTDEAATSLAFAWKDERGDGHFWLLRGADASLSPADAETAGIERLAALVVGSVSLAAQPSRDAIDRAIEIARAAQVPVVFDVNLRPTAWSNPPDAARQSERIARSSQVVKLSLDDAVGLFGTTVTPRSAVERVLGMGADTVVLTDGDRGAWFASRSEPNVSFVPAFTVNSIEPTGAGDAFLAALVERLLTNQWSSPTFDDVRVAAAAGALATTKRGAWDGLPNHAQLAAFLETA